MYYEEIEKMGKTEAMDYSWETVDGIPRYRRYKNSLNAVHLISSCDEKFDIESSNFSDLTQYYDSVEWVAQNDPDALKHIMNTLTEPVTYIVKQKFIGYLKELGYYTSCAIVKDHLLSYPVPKERTLQRKKENAIKDIEENMLLGIKQASELLFKLKTEEKHKLYDENLRDALGTLLNIDALYIKNIKESINSMEWLRENSPNNLKKLFPFKVCVEIKEQLIKIIAKTEMYNLCAFMDKLLETHNMSFFYEIPPYNPNQKSDLIPPFLEFDEDDDD